MATPVVFNGVNYSVPAFGDVGYAQGPGNLSAYLIAIASGTLQITGGLFSLTADVDFGPNFGLVSVYYKSASADIAQSGVLRLANSDFIAWRNFANSADLPLAVNGSDQLTFNGVVIGLVGGSVTSVTGTANQIDSTGGTTPVLSLSSTLIFPGTATGTLTGHSTLDLALTGGTMSGVIDMGANKIANLAAATVNGDALRYEQLIGIYLPLAGGTMSGAIAMGANKITGLANGTVSTDAAAFGQITAQTATTSINGTFIGMGRNRIINGEMIIDQVNEGNAITVNSTATFYSVDQMQASGLAAAGVYTLQRSTSTPPTGFINFLRATCSTADASIAAGDLYWLETKMEGLNLRDFLLGTASAKTFTLSFWVRSSLTGIYTGAFKNSAGNRAYPFEYTINVANTWEQKTITATGDITGTWLTTNGVGMNLVFGLAVGSTYQGTANAWAGNNTYGTSNQVNFLSSNVSRTWDLTGVQLEIGSVSTAYEHCPFQYQLFLCQRYYWKTFPIGTAVAQNSATQRGSLAYRAPTAGTTNATNSVRADFKVPMRTNPTITFYNPNSANANWRNATLGADSGSPTAYQSSEDTLSARNGQVAGDALVDILIIHATADARF